MWTERSKMLGHSTYSNVALEYSSLRNGSLVMSGWVVTIPNSWSHTCQSLDTLKGVTRMYTVSEAEHTCHLLVMERNEQRSNVVTKICSLMKLWNDETRRRFRMIENNHCFRLLTTTDVSKWVIPPQERNQLCPVHPRARKCKVRTPTIRDSWIYAFQTVSGLWKFGGTSNLQTRILSYRASHKPATLIILRRLTGDGFRGTEGVMLRLVDESNVFAKVAGTKEFYTPSPDASLNVRVATQIMMDSVLSDEMIHYTDWKLLISLAPNDRI